MLGVKIKGAECGEHTREVVSEVESRVPRVVGRACKLYVLHIGPGIAKRPVGLTAPDCGHGIVVGTMVYAEFDILRGGQTGGVYMSGWRHTMSNVPMAPMERPVM